MRFDAFRSMILEDQGKPAYSHDEVVELILAYIHRDDEEIEELKQGKQVELGAIWEGVPNVLGLIHGTQCLLQSS